MNRRDFLRHSALLAAGGARLLAQPPARSKPMNITHFEPIRRNVGYFTGRGGTIGWLAAPDALVVVDTQFPDTALACLQGLSGKGQRTIDATLNTHHHHDHTGGNGVFKAASKVLVAQAQVPKLQFEAAQRAEASPRVEESATVAAQTYADTTFDEVWRRELGTEIVTAERRGPAHTAADSVVIFEKANVIHLGDLVFNRMYPVVDRPGGASIKGWVKALEDCAAAYPADAVYLYGHGHPKFGVSGGRADLLVMRDFFAAVLERVQKDIAAGKERSAVVAVENLPGFPEFAQPLPNRLGGVLGAAFDELTGAPV